MIMKQLAGCCLGRSIRAQSSPEMFALLGAVGAGKILLGALFSDRRLEEKAGKEGA